ARRRSPADRILELSRQDRAARLCGQRGAGPMSLIVLCAGGHARVVIEALRSRGIRPAAVTDSDAARVGQSVGGLPITGPDEDILKMDGDSGDQANGLGNRASRGDS